MGGPAARTLAVESPVWLIVAKFLTLHKKTKYRPPFLTNRIIESKAKTIGEWRTLCYSGVMEYSYRPQGKILWMSGLEANTGRGEITDSYFS